MNSRFLLKKCLLVVFIVCSVCSVFSCDGDGVYDLLGDSLIYSNPDAVYIQNEPITCNMPKYVATNCTWEITPELPAGLRLDAGTGFICGTPTDIQSATTYTITLSNHTGEVKTDISITVIKDLTYLVKDAVYTQNEPIQDNIPDYTGTVSSWSIDPALPAGLDFDVLTGVISGTPTVEKFIEQFARTYVVTATTSTGLITADISIIIRIAAPKDLTYSDLNAVYTQNEIIQDNIPFYIGTVSTWTISPNLPAGLSFDVLTGVISGTPTVIQPDSIYTVTATNSTGSTTVDIIIGIDAAPKDLTYSKIDAVYTQYDMIQDNIPSYTGTVSSWSINPSLLPEGLNFNTGTGYISGTPTVIQPVTDYTVTATNLIGSTTVDISITVNIAAPRNLTYLIKDAVYTRYETIKENYPSYTGTVSSWSITPNLPAGLSFDVLTGVISGTPVNAQTSKNYTVMASNSTGFTTVDISITVNIEAPKDLTYSNLSAIYTQNEIIQDNIPSYTGTVSSWSITPNLPAGLSFDVLTGVISGTPVNAQTSKNYTVMASNSTGFTTVDISITVNIEAPKDLTYSNPDAVYTRYETITYNIPDYTGTVSSWSIDPALPAGLSFDVLTGVISGTPTVIQPDSIYTVTATNLIGSTTVDISIGIKHYYIGMEYGGGYIFYIDDTWEHGLIVAPVDQGGPVIYAAPGVYKWGTKGITTGAIDTKIGSGYANTLLIVNNDPLPNKAADICYNLVLNGYNDWFLPSKDELALLFSVWRTGKILSPFGHPPYDSYYWSSSEYEFYPDTDAWQQNFMRDDFQITNSKSYAYNSWVRAVRAF